MKLSYKVLAASMLLLMAACGNKNQFTLEATLDPALNDQMAYLYNGVDQTPIDSVKVENGMVKFEGEVTEPYIGILSMHELSVPCIIEPGNITFNDQTSTIGGTPLNDTYNQYVNMPEKMQLKNTSDSLLQLYIAAENQEEQQRIMEEFSTMHENAMKAITPKTKELLNQNKDNVLGVILIMDLISNNPEITADEFNSYMEGAGTIITENKLIKNISKVMMQKAKTAVGQKYIDIPGIDYATGETSSLKAIIDGKIAVVDFWASWCGPCKQEIKEYLINLNNKYKDKGVVVVGVDISDKIPAHDQAVKTLGINYPQLIDTTRFAGETYGIEGIPHIMIVDQEGNIVARGTRGEETENKIVELLGK